MENKNNNKNNNNIDTLVTAICQSAKKASQQLSLIAGPDKNHALQCMADALRHHKKNILKANQEDCMIAKEKKLSTAFLDRLSLDSDKLQQMAKGLEEIILFPDPIGSVLSEMTRPNQLKISRVRVPLGVIGVIYESRPNVTADAAGLCIKSGNAIILRGGSESFHSSTAIVTALHEGLKQTVLPIHAVQMLPTTDRQAVDILLTMDKYIDVIVPRGGMKLIEYITAHSRIPLFKHLAGLCHTYIHQSANLAMARKIVLNAKMRRTGICGATEVLLVDAQIAEAYLPIIIDDLIQAGCEVRGEPMIKNIDNRILLSSYEDYDTEFLDAIIAIKIVNNIHEAIEHIREHGTAHTEAIITDDKEAAQQFFNEVDSAIVMHNASTQFADGGEFGMGAEIGIATGKLHARGPVGIEQLTTFKYLVRGSGQIRP
jgi:glutamate-5-semialdehyde dehydrogenase